MKHHINVLIGCNEPRVVDALRILLTTAAQDGKAFDFTTSSRSDEFIQQARSGAFELAILHANCLSPTQPCTPFENATHDVTNIKTSVPLKMIAITTMDEWVAPLRASGADPYTDEFGGRTGFQYGGLMQFVGGGNPGLNSSDFGWEFEQKRKPGGMFANPAAAEWMLARGNFAENLFSGDERRAMEKQRDRLFDASQQYNAVGMDKGDYLKDFYAGQSFRPDQTGAKVDPWAMGNLGAMNIGNPQMAQYGGGFDDNVYYMSDDEIQQFMAAGGQIEYLD